MSPNWSHTLKSGFLTPWLKLSTNLSGSWDPAVVHDHEKIYLMPYVNNKGIDQPVHPGSLIRAFVVHYLDITMSIIQNIQTPASFCNKAGQFEPYLVEDS